MRSLKNKRVLWAVLAVVFVFALFFIKNKTLFINSENGETPGQNLAYDKRVVGDLINQDTDKDGIPDWEEKLRGADPMQKDASATQDYFEASAIKEDNLTQTDRLSREILATVASLTDSGQMDAALLEGLGESLALEAGGVSAQKIYTLSEIQVSSNNSSKATQNYGGAIWGLLQNQYSSEEVLAVLTDSLGEDGLNPEVLRELDPIIKRINKIIVSVRNLSVPSKLSSAHLSLLNGFEGVSEGLTDLKQADEDPIVSLNAVSKFGANMRIVDDALGQIADVL
ncbi:hypothetical protein A3G06_00370 [Candidatus Nomurabacteria bacterium RIFCSPLOWO2_12_FULL_46_14]|uniref:Uncharacterized protein n=1 Tax=Candidatus Nomurabacteria bacterium RIFCSPLOWO2_12_FULL_46_14 TaxID=1801797 RepID=A0A1F6Y8Y6_9BACT|nr:MAG: hypothetical protein A3G06_00370 [Candidatus Nomurabacteria bacterium RIFCSPLOWO2_12_FULL_46_14]